MATTKRQSPVTEYSWFHAIDLGNGAVTPGRFPAAVPPNYTLFGVFELLRSLRLAEAACLDVGTMDGLAAFVMKSLGARRVVAADLERRGSFELAREALDLEIDYQVPVAALDLERHFGRGAFDVVTMAGVLYHVLDPLAVLVAARQVLKHHGLLVLETWYLFDEPGSKMTFNPSDVSRRGIDRANVFWRPSMLAVAGMLEIAGYQVVETITVDSRLAVLARAVRPGEVESVTPRIRSIHESYLRYGNYKEALGYEAIAGDRDHAAVSYDGAGGHRFLFRARHQPVVPHHPAWEPPAGARLRDLQRSTRFWLGEQVAARRAGLRSWADAWRA